MMGSRPLAQLASKKRLILLFSTVLVLFVARLGLADLPPERDSGPAAMTFEDFLEFDSVNQAGIRAESAPGCPLAAGPVIKPVLSGLPSIVPPQEARPEQAETIVLGGTGYNYLRDR
jgi:hypothetical protein